MVRLTIDVRVSLLIALSAHKILTTVVDLFLQS